MLGAVFFFHMVQREDSWAGSTMVFTGMETIQDTTPLYRGMVNQPVIGIIIHTKGTGHRLSLASLEVAARGTTKPVSAIIENARIWSTGQVDFFFPSNQIGTTIPVIPDENFTIPLSIGLEPGDNYFWLTFDIKPSSEKLEVFADAECISATIGTLKYEPDLTGRPGAIRIMNNLAYFSTKDGDIASLGSWNSKRDGSGEFPSSFNDINTSYFIQPGHQMNNQLNGCPGTIIIERNGLLWSSASLRAEKMVVCAGGTWMQEKEMTQPEELKEFEIRDGGNYMHLNKGRIPGKSRKFFTASTIVLNNYSQATFTDKITWGNLIIAAKGSRLADVSGCFRNIRGNLEIRSTGAETYLYCSQNDTVNIGKDMIINGGKMAMSSASNHVVLNVANRLHIRSGWLSDIVPGNKSKGSAHLNLNGDMIISGGTLLFGAENSRINVCNKTRWSQQNAEVYLGNLNILTGSELFVTGEQIGPLLKNRTFEVESNARLFCGHAVVNGEGNFKLNTNATIATGHLQGLASDGLTGSIQTENRIFSSEATYIFYQGRTPQRTGVFNTTPEKNAVRNLILRKEKYTDVVLLEQPLKVKGRFILESGNLNKNSFILDVKEKVTADNFNRLPVQE